MLDNYYSDDNSTENIVHKELLSKLLLFHINTFCNKNNLILILKGTTSLRLLYNLPKSFEDLKFDIIGNNSNLKINKLFTYLEKNLDKDITIQKINKFIYKISYILEGKEINIIINIITYKKVLGDTEYKVIQNNLIITNFVTPFYFKIKTYNLETILIQIYLDIILDNKIEKLFNIWWYFSYTLYTVQYLNLTYYNNIIKETKICNSYYNLQYFEVSEKTKFIQHFKDTLNKTLDINKKEILVNIKKYILENSTLEYFEISLNNKDFLVKSSILSSLPVK